MVYYNEQQAETLISENATYTFAVNGDMYVYAKFAEKEMYTFFAYPSEVGYFTENGQPVEFSESRRVEKGTQITLTANVREQGYRFAGWYYYNEQQAETLISENAMYTFAVNGDMYVYAKFAEKEMYTFFAYPSEVGYFTENGQPVEFSESRRVEKGTQITLTANVREQGYKFAGWYIVNSYDEEKRFYSSNATETFTITDNTYIFAQFAEKESVTLTVIAGKHGNVFDNNAEGYSPPEKQLQFVVTEGSGVQVSASGETVYFKFVGWYDGEGETAALISDKDVYEFTVTDDATVYARFDYSFSVSARIESEGAGEFTGAGVSDEGYLYIDDLSNNASVTVEVKPNAGYCFIGWFPSSDSEGYNADSLLSTDLKYTFTVGEETGNVHLTALFRGTVTEIKLHDLNDCGFETDENGNPKEEYVINLNSERWVDFEHFNMLGKVGDKYERLCRGLEYRVESTIGISENNMLDTSRAGTYTVTYTYLADPALKVVITIRIVEQVNFLAQCREYHWGYITENGKKVDFGNGRPVETGTQITLTAVANEGYNFLGWYKSIGDQTEECISTDSKYTFTVNETMYVYAKFVETQGN